MFYVIKDEKLFEYGDSVNSAWEYPNEAQELSGIDLLDFQNNSDKYKVINDKLVDISQTDEYLSKVAEEQKEARKSEIEELLKELDIKCIRAMREGGNDNDGVPFIEKYQAEILALREEYNTL